MELKQLFYFVTVVNEGNISNAAKKLFMTQPPLSKQIKQLEEEFGCLLFERGKGQIQLTQAGSTLYKRAQKLLELAELTRSEMEELLYGVAGTLRLGVVSSVSGTLLNLWVKEFSKLYPQVHFALVEANTYELLEKLDANLIEMAVVRTPFPARNYPRIELSQEKMLAVGDRHFFGETDSAGETEILLEQIVEKPLIIYRRWEAILRDRFEQLGKQPNIYCVNDDAKTTALWANSGLGVGIIPSSAKALLSENIVKKQIADEDIVTTVCMIYNEKGHISRLAREFMNFTAEMYRYYGQEIKTTSTGAEK